jgi:parvulin-like peptidyl-prolyl isomerase
MVWKKIKLPKFTWRPSRENVNRIVLGSIVAAALVGSYYWGRRGGLADGRTPIADLLPHAQFMPVAQPADRTSEVVAYLYDGQVPITRRELGDYLIDRFGGERIEFLVHRKIIEIACQAQHITISDAEIRAQMDQDLRAYNMTEKQFADNILKKYNKTIFEYKEDMIRPQLCLQRYVRDKINVSEEDIQKGFEAKFGEKVECRIIVLSPEQRKDAVDIWTQINQDPAQFEVYAKKQCLPAIASAAGRVPPVHRFFGPTRGAMMIEEEAFKLKPGEISPRIEMPPPPDGDGTTVILRCERRIPADGTKNLSDERAVLYQEIREARIGDAMKSIFAELLKKAHPQIFLEHQKFMQVEAPQTAATAPSAPPVQAVQQQPPPGMPPPHAELIGMPMSGN